MRNIFSIWSEGYNCAGGSGDATYHGEGSADTFRNACKSLARKSEDFNKHFDADAMTYWGCGLFDNEADARRNFG